MMSKSDFVEKKIIIINMRAGEKASFSNENLIIKDKGNKTKLQCSCYRIIGLFIIGNFSVTNVLITKARKYGFSIFMLSPSLRIMSCVINGPEGNTRLHRKQYEYNGLDLAKHIVDNKIKTERDAIMNIRNRSDFCNETVERIDESSEMLKKKLDYDQILSIEGRCAKRYFKCVFEDFDWIGRSPRSKMDILNTTMDIGYSILFNYVDMILCLYDFDEYVGVLHKEFYKRKSLVCDLMEPFRVIVDHQIIKSFNLNQFQSDDFDVFNNEYHLKWSANSKYYSVLVQAVLDYKEEIFTYIRSYYRAFMRDKSAEDFPWFEYC